MMKRVIRWILLLITVLALAGIPALAEQADAALPEATAMPPAAEPAPTAIPEPTAAPEPQIRFTRDLSGSYAEYGNKGEGAHGKDERVGWSHFLRKKDLRKYTPDNVLSCGYEQDKHGKDIRVEWFFKVF